MTTTLTIIMLGSMVAMTCLYLLWLKNGRSAMVDVGWSVCLLAAILFMATAGTASLERRVLLAVLAGGWAFRLGLHLFKDRVLTVHEDGRYVRMLNASGDKAKWVMLLFFQAQAVFALVFSLPIAAAMYGRTGSLDWLDALGVLIGLCAIAGESLADRQLAAFRSRPDTRGTTCREGLWRYSRHPNYFFEWVFWFAFIPINWGADSWLLTALGPAFMLFFLLKLTGIPHTERQAASHRPDYVMYQKETPMFFPGPPRRP
jgi:steroid 5-alpha reductase family enzyme